MDTLTPPLDVAAEVVPALLSRSRRVERLVAGRPTEDGAGVKLLRLLTPDLQRRLDPFLMLDAFGTENPGDTIAGFPDHPHRGFETVTVMLEGRMRHRDSAGNDGLLGPGGVQWMTAGRGVIHSEMPEQADGRMEGFQLWLNLPAADKLRDPWYRDIGAAEIPLLVAPGARVRLIAGTTHGIDAVVQRESTAPLLLDLQLEPGARWDQPLPAGHNAFVYVYRGALTIDGSVVLHQRMAILGPGADADGVALQAGDAGARVLLVAGQPLNEPIAQYGPFVMNTNEQIFQAVDDFRHGRLA
ncbi:MAG: pirin family protein [Rubrivivax sp.]